MKDKTKNTLYWIVLPFASIIAAVLAFAFCQMCQINESHNEIEEGFGYWFWVFLSFFSSSCAFVYTAALVAPKRKDIVAVVTTAFVVFLCTLWGIIGFIATIDRQSSLYLFAIISAISSTIGAIIVGAERYKKYANSPNKISPAIKNPEIILGQPKVMTENDELDCVGGFNIDEIQQMHDDLIEEYDCCKAVDIVIEKLANELSHHSNTGWSEEIDKHLRVLELLQPINGENKYSHFTTPEALAEIATIDYIKISEAITEFTRMAYNADVRGQAILAIMTDPNMKMQANKLHIQKRLYEDTIDTLVKIQNHIAKTLHNEHKLEDTGDILSSKMYSIDGIACGFIANGKLYLNSDMGNHKAPIHLYTYVWMKHCKKVEPELFNKIYDYAVTTDYFKHIRFSPRFSDLDIEEAAIKAVCYLTSFDAKDIFLDETKKQELLMKLKTAECENELLIRYPLAAFIKKEDVSSTLKTL